MSDSSPRIQIVQDEVALHTDQMRQESRQKRVSIDAPPAGARVPPGPGRISGRGTRCTVRPCEGESVTAPVGNVAENVCLTERIQDRVQISDIETECGVDTRN